MRKTITTTTIVGMWFVVCIAVAVADFWESKPFTTWSDDEVDAILTDSPWSRTASVHTPNASLANRVGGLSGGVVGAGVGSRGGIGAGGGGVGGDGSGNLGGGSFMPPPQRIRLTVRWESARPLRQASVRRQVGLDSPIPPDAEQLLGRDDSVYRVAVAGIPLELSEAVESLDAVQRATSLRPGDRAAIFPLDVQLRYEEDLLVIESHFSRASLILLADKEVEFITKLGPTQIKTTFTLADMTVNGRLVL